MRNSQGVFRQTVSTSKGSEPTQGQRKSQTRVGFEPTTFGFDRRCFTAHPQKNYFDHSSISAARPTFNTYSNIICWLFIFYWKCL